MTDVRKLFYSIGFKGDDSGIKKMDSAADKMKKNIGNAGKAMSDSSKSAASKMKSDVGSVESSYKSKAGGMLSSMKDAFGGMKEKGKTALDGLKSKLEGLSQGTGTAKSGIMNIVKALGLVALASAGISMVKQAVSSAFDRIDTMDQFKRTMTAITGNSESAGQALETLKGITKGTAYGLDVAAKATQDFVTRGMSVEDATKSVGAWGDAVAFYGKGTNEELSNVSDAIAKMRTKGTVEMDQLNRLFDSGIDAVGMYAQANNMSSSEVQDALSKGQLSADDFLSSVENAMQTGAGGVLNIAGKAKEAGESWAGTFSNMAAAVTRGMEGTVKSIEEALTANGLPTMKEMVVMVGEKFEELGQKIGPMIGPIISKVKEVIEVLKPWMPVIVGIGGALLGFAIGAKAIGIATAAMTLFNIVTTANPIGIIIMAVIGAITALVAVVTYLWNTNEGFRNAVIAIWDKIKEVFISAWEAIKPVWEAVQPFFSALWEGIKILFAGAVAFIQDPLGVAWIGVKAIWGLAVGWFTGIVTGIAEKFIGISEAIKSAFTGAVEFVQGLPAKFLEWGKDMIQNMIDGIRAKISGVVDAVKEVGEKIKSFVGFSVPEKGVLSKSDQWMPHFMENLSGGIYDNMHLVKSAVSALTSTMGMDIQGTISREEDEKQAYRSADNFKTSDQIGAQNRVNNNSSSTVIKNEFKITVGAGSSGKAIVADIEKEWNLCMERYEKKMRLRNPQTS